MVLSCLVAEQPLLAEPFGHVMRVKILLGHLIHYVALPRAGRVPGPQSQHVFQEACFPSRDLLSAAVERLQKLKVCHVQAPIKQ